MLEREFQYFLEDQKTLVDKYSNKHIVIIGEEVVGAYDSEEVAYLESAKKYEVGTFLIQFCTSGEDAYTQTFHSRVTFA